MNKANVILLVVVSSLITYISTATQPAMTAGVAQERWEYGSIRNVKYPIGDNLLNSTLEFPSGSVKLEMFTTGRSKRYDIVTSILGEDEERYSDENAAGLSVRELRTMFALVADQRAQKCFEEGWEPFQVIEGGCSPTRITDDECTENIIYVRRRIQ